MDNPRKTFELFVNRYRDIVKVDTEKRFAYFVDLSTWLNDAPRGTAQKLSETLGYNKFWASNNIRPIRSFGEKKCHKLLFDLDWPWGEVVLLSAAKAERRDKLLERALAGEERKNVVTGIFQTFRGTKVANKNMKAMFLDALEEASPSQIIKWLGEYLSEAPKTRAKTILKGLAVLSMRTQMAQQLRLIMDKPNGIGGFGPLFNLDVTYPECFW